MMPTTSGYYNRTAYDTYMIVIHKAIVSGAAATTLVTPQTGLDGTKAAGQEKDEVESESQARSASCQWFGLSKLLCPPLSYIWSICPGVFEGQILLDMLLNLELGDCNKGIIDSAVQCV